MDLFQIIFFIGFQFIWTKSKDNNGHTVLLNNVPEKPTTTRFIRLSPKQPANSQENHNNRICLRLKVLGCEKGKAYFFTIKIIKIIIETKFIF